MFWDKWIPEKYLVKSEICGVELNFNEEGFIYNYTILKNKSKKLSVTHSGTINNISDLPASVLKNKIPLALIINGKGVIFKKIFLSETDELNFEELVRTNLPAINSSDFFIQLFRQADNSGFISICRKSQLDPLLTEIKNKKFELADIFIGVPAVIGLQPLWNNFNTLQTSSHSVTLTNNLADTIVNNLPTNNDPVKLEDISLTPSQMLAFSGGLSYLLQNSITETENEELLNVSYSHKEKNKFRFLLICVIGFAFTLAAINVFFYTQYFDTNNKLETELSVYQGKYDQINQLLTDYQKKKDLIENAGVLSKNKLSEYADKIAISVPPEVTLSEMHFSPKIDDIEETEDSLVTFKTKTILLRGNCNKSLTINEWINVLKMQKFIKDVSLEKFVYNNDGILPNYEIKLLTE